MDSATEFLFGDCVYSIAAPLPYPWNAPLTRSATAKAQLGTVHTFSAAFAETQLRLAERARFPLWQLREIWKDRTQEPMSVCLAYLDPIVQRALERKKARGGEKVAEEESECLLDTLVNSTDGMHIFSPPFYFDTEKQFADVDG